MDFAHVELIDKLFFIVEDLDAREQTFNCLDDNLSWDELCEKGIEILQKLKG